MMWDLRRGFDSFEILSRAQNNHGHELLFLLWWTPWKFPSSFLRRKRLADFFSPNWWNYAQGILFEQPHAHLSEYVWIAPPHNERFLNMEHPSSLHGGPIFRLAWGINLSWLEIECSWNTYKYAHELFVYIE